MIPSVLINGDLKSIFLSGIKYPCYKKNKVHEMCSYVAMYPAWLVQNLILRYTVSGDKIYDPFSGRGTTILESRMLGRYGYGSDLNPLAYILSKSKSFKISLKSIFSRIEELEKKYIDACLEIDQNDFEYMKTYYSFNVYRQLFFLKKEIGERWADLNKTDVFILSCLLGIMHGYSRKNGTSSFCSISMSNTNAMSKNYVDNYVRTHNLKFPINENVFEKIRNKISRISDDINIINKTVVKTKIKKMDALNCHKTFSNTFFDLILTSPPYLNIHNYTRENWIRLWMLGYLKNNISSEIILDDSHGINEYKNFIIQFMNSAYKCLSNKGKLIMVIGNVKDKYNFKDLWNSIKDKTKFQLIDHYEDDISKKKSTRKNGKKAGRATQIDNICVFSKII